MSDERPLDQNPSSGGTPLQVEDRPEVNEVDLLAQIVQDGEGDEDEEEEDEEEEDDFVESLPPVLRRRVEKLKDLNEQRDKIMDEYLKERAALEEKFANLCKPLYEERKTILISSDSTGRTTEDAEEDVEDIVGIPDFWTTAMENIETIEELITTRDGQCLSFLEDIQCTDFANGLGFVIVFHFKENPFFENKVLTKRYDVPNLLIDDEPILKNVVGCDIKWKDDMCLTYRSITKKQRNKKGQIRHVKKEEKQESFFHFFCPPTIPNIAEMDEEEADAIEEAFDHDYDVAQSFRKYIIPKGVLWFTGEAMQQELQGIYENGDNLMSPQAVANIDAASGSPFPPPVEGTEEPECKQN